MLILFIYLSCDAHRASESVSVLPAAAVNQLHRPFHTTSGPYIKFMRSNSATTQMSGCLMLSTTLCLCHLCLLVPLYPVPFTPADPSPRLPEKDLGPYALSAQCTSKPPPMPSQLLELLDLQYAAPS